MRPGQRGAVSELQAIDQCIAVDGSSRAGGAEDVLDDDLVGTIDMSKYQVESDALCLDVLRLDAFAESQHIGDIGISVGDFVDGVDAVAEVEQVGVAVEAAMEGVIPGAADEEVVAGSSADLEGVVAGATIEAVGPGASVQDVIAFAAV